MEDANFSKLTSMHFYAWKSGLKTGMYYLRTKAATDAIKFTLDNTKKKAPEPAKVAEGAVAVKKEESSARSKEINTQPLTALELKEMIQKAKVSEDNDEDCLMCGS